MTLWCLDHLHRLPSEVPAGRRELFQAIIATQIRAERRKKPPASLEEAMEEARCRP